MSESADLFTVIRFRTHIQLTPGELDHQFPDRLLSKLRSTYEGNCSRFGYIKPGSIVIIKRSLGCLLKPHFNGHVRFELICNAEACNPPQGLVVEAVVKNKNTFGLLAESSFETDGDIIPVMDIIVPKKSAGISSDLDVDSQKIGDKVYIEVVVKRFLVKDKKLSIIGRLVAAPSSIREDAKTAARMMREEVVEIDEDADIEQENLSASDIDIDEEEELEGDDDGVAFEQEEGAAKVVDVTVLRKAIGEEDHDELDDEIDEIDEIDDDYDEAYESGDEIEPDDEAF